MNYAMLDPLHKRGSKTGVYELEKGPVHKLDLCLIIFIFARYPHSPSLGTSDKLKLLNKHLQIVLEKKKIILLSNDSPL